MFRFKKTFLIFYYYRMIKFSRQICTKKQANAFIHFSQFITLRIFSTDTKLVKIVVADKGYDDEKNHKFCHEELGIASLK